jgi:hypothetical protein
MQKKGKGLRCWRYSGEHSCIPKERGGRGDEEERN